MKKLLLLILSLSLQLNIFPQISFPLDIGTKWYYQGYHYDYSVDFPQKKKIIMEL